MSLSSLFSKQFVEEVFYCGGGILSGGVGGVVICCGGGAKSLLLGVVQLSFEVSKIVLALLFQL